MSGLTHRTTEDDSPNRSSSSPETVIGRDIHQGWRTSLSRNSPSIKLKDVKLIRFCLSLVLCATAACGDATGGSLGSGGHGGSPLEAQSSYRLSCTIDTLVLEIPIEIPFELDRPYTVGGSAELTFSASVTFEEQAATALIEAGVSKIDIISLEITPWMAGTVPSTLRTFLAAAPINDFDLETDTDDNGIPGPHRIELDTVTTTSTVVGNAQEVVVGLGLGQVSLVLGEFEVPRDCLRPELVGFSTRFPVTPAP